MDFAQYLLVKWYMENKIKTAVEVGFSLFFDYSLYHLGEFWGNLHFFRIYIFLILLEKMKKI